MVGPNKPVRNSIFFVSYVPVHHCHAYLGLGPEPRLSEGFRHIEKYSPEAENPRRQRGAKSVPRPGERQQPLRAVPS